MTSRQLELLQRERDSFLAHEKRIMLERDEILVNIRNHICVLDNEILRLGRETNESEHPHPSNLSYGDVIPSTAQIPPVEQGRPQIAGENSSKKRRGRPRKSESKIVEIESETASSDERLSTSRSFEIERPNDALSQLTSIATSLVNLKTELRFADVANAVNKKIASWQDWQCDCGELISHKKSRCGMCRRWKGGKREKKWTLKGRRAKCHLEQAQAIYNMISTTAIDAASSLNSKYCYAHDDVVDEINIRTEAEIVLRNLTLAVSKANEKQTNKKMERKRRRGHKEQNAVEDEGVNTLVKPQREETYQERDKTNAPFAFESLCIVAKMHMNNDTPQDEIHPCLPKS